MTQLTVTLDAQELEQALAAAPRKIFNAQRSAIRTTTTFADKEMKRRMSAATGLPSSVFSVYRVRKQSSDARGQVWLGIKPVKARFAGKLQQQDFGAQAGRYYWQGGFIAKMKTSNMSSIYKRKTAARLPLMEQTVELPMAQTVAEQVMALTQTELQKRYLEKLEQGLK
jgi:hypothetical protein